MAHFKYKLSWIKNEASNKNANRVVDTAIQITISTKLALVLTTNSILLHRGHAFVHLRICTSAIYPCIQLIH